MAPKQQGPPLSHLEIWIEPGRWLSTPAMHILVRVLDKKDAATLITDGGTNLLGWERPLTEFILIVNLTKPGLKEKGMNAFGSLCTPPSGAHPSLGRVPYRERCSLFRTRVPIPIP